MAVDYQVLVQCKARAPSGAVMNISPGTYTVVGDEPGRPAVWLIRESREIEILYSEFQRLKSAGAVKRL